MVSNELIELYDQSNQFGRLIGLMYQVQEDGTLINTITIEEKHLATPIASHGGVLATLADSTLGMAALMISKDNGNLVSTVEFKISYLKPARLGDTITGVPRVRQVGKKIIFVEADFINQDGVVVALANGTFNQYPMDKVFQF